jgi:HTH-type transcriptional regulator / antitoxin HipB
MTDICHLSEFQINSSYLNDGYLIVASRLPSQPLVTALQLGVLLKTARKHRKLTQADVARRLGLSQNRVSHLEQHPEELSFKQLLGWCAVVGLELHLGDRPDPVETQAVEW